MNDFSPFGIPGFDPSKMDPKVLMELSQLIQKLPAEQLSRMQTLMHNTMAGYDMKKEMEEFEKGLPPDFREKIIKILGPSVTPSASPYSEIQGMKDNVIDISPSSAESTTSESSVEMDLRQARLTILKAVASGSMQPEEAEKLLFNT
ncbi:MAG: hypothetical protein ABI041_08575 [Bdellovibrionia bacterium]